MASCGVGKRRIPRPEPRPDRRVGEQLNLESAWLQNHRITGIFGADGVLRLQHGLGHGEEPMEFGYGR
jgi:hypothetical protein